MKTKFSRRILAFVLAISLVVPMLVFNVDAAAKDLTLDFSNTSNRVSLDTSKQVWSQNGITLTNTKTANSSNVAEASGHIRIYKNSDVTIECAGMTKIELSCTGSKYATAPTGLTNATVSTSGTKITITLNSAVDTFSFNCNGSQLRVTKMVVTTEVSDALPSITLTGDENVIVNETTTIVPETANITETIAWESSDETVATVVNGEVTGHSIGKATITAKANGAEATKEIKVYPAAGATLTIAEALKVCELTGTANTTDSYVVEGVIEDINTVYDETNDRITVTITDGPDSIMVYRMAGGSDLAVGDKIIVTGKLVNYSSNTPEFATGSTYTKVAADEDTTAIKEALGKIAAYMSLGYTYTTRVETVSGVVDTLNRSTTGREGTSYDEWTATGASGVTYKGQSAGGNDSIQLRSNNSNSGIVTTTSIGTAKSIKVVWNSNTTDGRTLDIYGSNTAFTAATQLYNISGDIEKIGSIVCGKSTELEITGDYAYIGIRSNSGAMYLESIEIAWNSTNGTGGETTSKTIYESSAFAFRFAVDAALTEIDGVDEYGIRVTAGDKEVYYTPDTVTVWGNDGEKCYVTVNLGDIINDTAKLGTEFKVEAYVVIDGFVHVSEQSKTYSVATLVQHYMEDLGIAEVEHLYDYLVEKGLI